MLLARQVHRMSQEPALLSWQNCNRLVKSLSSLCSWHPLVPVLHFLLLAAAIHTFLAKHRWVCAPWKGPTTKWPPRRGGAVSPASASHSLSHVTSSAMKRRFPATLWLTHGCALPSHNSMLAFSHIRQESASLSTKIGSSIWGMSVLNKTVQESAVPSLALLSTLAFPFQVFVQILSEVDTCL